jgi:hypothetical protein
MVADPEAVAVDESVMVLGPLLRQKEVTLVLAVTVGRA